MNVPSTFKFTNLSTTFPFTALILMYMRIFVVGYLTFIIFDTLVLCKFVLLKKFRFLHCPWKELTTPLPFCFYTVTNLYSINAIKLYFYVVFDLMLVKLSSENPVLFTFFEWKSQCLLTELMRMLIDYNSVTILSRPSLPNIFWKCVPNMYTTCY